ncbi:SIR2 family protein [Levilactobacillus tongjiangensis]|uniref:SIR2 family protein n=1 Tax=Levilactobacillus tongjiangensis TaxID=2486023 RepID=A0ABW1SSX7_9LACO|nr:SIR2 family protein [Levilactobacillus tongjiangensis]
MWNLDNERVPMNLTRYNSEDIIDSFISDIVDARREESLICVVGAGVSISQGYPDWNHYVQELINYWTSNLRNLVKNSETLATKVERTDILFLESLSDSSQSNKRKVDLVNFMVKKYCNTGNSETSETMYQNYYLECERFIFSESEPLFHENTILNELVKLNAAFLTTNYDEEIENAYHSILGGNPQVFPDAFSIEGSLTSNMVIHLHGLPSINWSRVISSSKSYTDLYLKPNDVHSKVRDLFSGKKKPVIIYVGCSMEEDEVLTLLECKGLNIQHYALMKYDDSSHMPQENETRNSIIQSYYNQEQSVQLIWYGNRFSDLTKFSAKLAESVHDLEMSFLPNPDKLEEILLSSSSQTDFLNALNGALRTKTYYVVDSIFKKYSNLSNEVEIKNIECTSESLLFKEHIATSSTLFIEYWRCIARVFGSLSSEFKEKIISEIEQIREWSTETEKVIFDIVLQYVNQNPNTKVDQLNRILSQFLNAEYFDIEVADQDIRCLWFSHQIDHSQSIFVATMWSDKMFFSFNQKTLPYLEASLSNLQNKTEYLSMSSLLENTIVKNLNQLIQSGKLTYERKQIFPDSFYKNVLIQRILIHLDLERGLDIGVLECLRKNLDINSGCLGSNAVEFSEKYNIPISDRFRYIDDESEISMMNPVQEQAFFKVQPIENIQQVDELIQKLKETPPEKSISLGDSFVDIGVEGQCNQLESVLNTKKQWESFKIENLDFIEKLISNIDLFKKYISVIVKMLNFALKNGYDTEKISDFFLRQLQKTSLPAFTVLNEKLFSKMIQRAKDDKEATIYRFLFREVDPTTLIRPDNTEFVDLTTFINTESGIYYSLIKKIETDFQTVISGTNKERFLERIMQQNMNYRCYLKGMFVVIFEEDPEVVSYSGFVGFSHNYHLSLNKKWTDKFKNVVEGLLSSQIDDNRVINNIALTTLVSIRPEEYQNSEHSHDVTNIKSAVFRQLLDFFIKRDDADRYNTSKWLQWFIGNYQGSVNVTISHLLREINDVSIKRGNQLLNIIERAITSSDDKLNNYVFSCEIYFDKLDHEHIGLIGSYLKIALAKNLLPINEVTLGQMTNILKKLSSEGLRESVFAVLDEAEQVLPPENLARLRDDFDYSNK